MRRREFLRLLSGAGLVLPSAAVAEPVTMPRIGYLGIETPAAFETRLRAFRQGLSEVGFEEGGNLAVEYRWAEGHNDRLPALAADLVRADVSVLAAPGGIAAALAAKAATSKIPIVFEIGADPVEAGLVSNLSHPSGNITGVSSLNTQIGPKRLELLHEIVSRGTNFALVVDPTNPKNAVTSAQNFQDAARNLGVKLEVLNVSTEADLEPLFTKLAELKASGLVINNDPFLSAHASELAELALRHSIPAAHQSRDFAVAGGLLSYGGSIAQSHHQAGVYVGRILKGEKVADLPVQQITKVEMTVNLKTAKLLGVTVPLSLSGRADEVIEQTRGRFGVTGAARQTSMERRRFLAVLGGFRLAVPQVAQAQSQAMPRIGYLGSEAAGHCQPRLRAFHEGLRELGFEEGRMRASRSYGFVRGALSNERPYRVQRYRPLFRGFSLGIIASSPS